MHCALRCDAFFHHRYYSPSSTVCHKFANGHFSQTRKGEGVHLGFFANISRTVWIFGFLFSAFYRACRGLHSRCKKTGGCGWKFSARWRQSVFI